MKNSTELLLTELSQNEFPLTWESLQAGLADGVAPGFVAGLWRKKFPDEIGVLALGNRRLLPSLPMTPETVFDLASVSKVFATATLAAVLVERGWLSWDTRVCTLGALAELLPESPIQIRHLLSHTAGFTAWQPFWEVIKESFAPEALYSIAPEKRQALMRRLVCAVVPEHPPGKVALYSDISFLLLGFALEEVTQMPLDQAVKKWVWQPMGICSAFYHRITQPPGQPSEQSWKAGTLESVAATEECSWRGGVLQGQVHDDNCWAMGGYAGHAGAFGTARDVLHFARGLMLTRILSPAVREQFWTRVSEPAGCERTLGWDTPSGGSSATGRFF